LTKGEDIRYRFQLAERRIDSLGSYQAEELKAYQAKRGSAGFTVAPQPSPFGAAASWELIGGNGVNDSWGGSCFQKTKALTIHGDDLIAGLFGPGGCVGVWRSDGTTWTKLIGADTSPDWAGLSYVQVLLSDGPHLYAGVD
ncbi:unnamed protein product, partial [Ectocarpus fasciculatus]